MGIPVARQDTIMAALCLSLPITVLTDRIATSTTGWSAIGAASYLAYPAICMQGAIAARPALRVFQVTPEANASGFKGKRLRAGPRSSCAV